ncbi:MAG: hypothetical protein IT223_07645 [Crocinitomicaceae bacterium]|nr:hypothetical protein [Crocinitomicaceae bacterium]
MKVKTIFFALVSIVVIQSCYYDIESELYPYRCISTDITYNGRIKRIIADNCLSGCHSGVAPTGNLDLSSYENVKAVAMDGALINALYGTNGFVKMPKGTSGLPDCEILAVQNWIDAGAKNN